MKRWWLHEAEWWQFWYPQSGMEGAAVAIVLMVVATVISKQFG